MLNQIVLVGRLVRDPELKESENGNNYSSITLAIPRSYKNENGEYDTDFVDCRLFGGIAQNTAEYCKKGDLIGVKGRVQSDSYEKDGETKYSTDIVAEKITFLSSTKTKSDDELEA